MPVFCFYCGLIGHYEKGCSTRRNDVVQDCVKNMQYSYWLRVGYKRKEWLGHKELGNVKGERLNDMVNTMPLMKNVGEGEYRSSDKGIRNQERSTYFQEGLLAEGDQGVSTEPGGKEEIEGNGREKYGDRGPMLVEGGLLATEGGKD